MNQEKSTIAFAEAKEYIPGGVNSPVRSFRSVGGVPPFIASAKGSKVYDIDGNEYIDYILSYGPQLLGHAPEVVTKAIEAATLRGTSYGMPTLAETELAKLVTKLVPSMEMVRMVNSGTEATMSALRLARAYTGRDCIIKFIGCYHGHSDGLLVKAGSGATTLGVPDSPGVPQAVASTTITVPFNDIEALEKVFAERGEEIAAIITEPTPGNMGLVMPKPGYLEAMYELCHKHGALFICDEVMSGFRSAQGGSQSLFNIDPDITCLGKVIGAGLPVAAYGGKKKIMQTVAPAGPMYQAGTLSGNPLAMAAGIAALNYIKENKVCAQVESMCAILCGGLEKAAKAAGVPVQVHRLGSMFTVFFSDKPVNDFDDACACDMDAFKLYFHTMLENGINLPPSQFETCFVSLAHSPEDIQRTIDVASMAFAKIAAR